LLQPGNLVDAVWRARLEEHLGTYTLEGIHDFSALVLDDPLRLKGLTAALGLLDAGLAERETHEALYLETLGLLRALEAPPVDGLGKGAEPWIATYVRWELNFLDCLGFGLDLTACAATGTTEGLVYVSPRSGRAVSRDAGAPYREKLLALPGFLIDPDVVADGQQVAAGLTLTGYFLHGHHFGADGRSMPAARDRFIDALGR
jgi:DNA repair protein RecO (recombination protein O)